MKKSIIVLLIAVLVAGFAFAGTLKGSAGLEFLVDLQPLTAEKGIWGFNNASELHYKFEFEYDTSSVEVMGEGKLWAELAIQASAYLKINSDNIPAEQVLSTYSVLLSKANIHIGEDITIGLLNEGKGVDFAFHYITDDWGDPVADYVYDDHEADNIGGFTVQYKDWYGGFGAKGRWDTDPAQFTFYGHGLTPEFKFADDQIAVQAGGYAAYSNTDAVFDRASFAGAGAKAEYAADKLNAYVGIDAMYDAGFSFEALAQATYAINDDGTVGADVYVVDGQSIYGDKEKLGLTADVWAAYKLALDEGIDLDLFAQVQVWNALIDNREIEVYASEVATVKEFTFTAIEDYYILNKLLMLAARVDYDGEKFDAYAQVKPSFDFADDPVIYNLGFECGISTDAIIDKAVLGLKYTRADFAKFYDPNKINDAGLVTAYVTISFDSTPAE